MFGRRKALGRPNERREIGIGRAQRHGDGSSPGLFLIVPLGPQVQRDIGFRVVRGLTVREKLHRRRPFDGILGHGLGLERCD